MGADGPNSQVRTHLLPQARVLETGQTAIFGKILLTDSIRMGILPEMLDGFTTVVGTNGTFMPLAGHQFRTDPREAAAQWCSGVNFHDTRDYLMMVFGTSVHAGRETDGSALLAEISEQIADWHPILRQLIRSVDPATVTATKIRSAEPVDPWESSPVTVVGDAIHCMVPAGIGAAVALRDAAVLAGYLTAPGGKGGSWVSAIHAYEAKMRVYGFEAVAASQKMGAP